MKPSTLATLSLVLLAPVWTSWAQGEYVEERTNVLAAAAEPSMPVSKVEGLPVFAPIDSLLLPEPAPIAANAAAGDGTSHSTLTELINEAIAATARRLGGDADAVVRYVSANIVYEDYAGVLKGAGGTYLTKAGNSADMALLTAALLETGRARSQVRFASCDRSGSDLGPAMQPEARLWSPVDYRALASEVRDPELSAALRWFGDALVHARRQAKHSSADLAKALQPILKPILDRRPTAVLHETSHVWVQLNKDGVWVDVDPAADSRSASCIPTVIGSSIPQDLYHRVILSVIVDRLESDALRSSEALRVEAASAELATAQVLFAFGEPIGLLARQPGAEDAYTDYTPIFRVDGKDTAGHPIPLPKIARADAPQDIAGGFADVLGGDFYGGVESAPLPADDVMGAWIQVEITGPMRAPVSVRSEIFDRLGMSTRVKGSGSVTLVPLLEVGGEYAALSGVWEIGFLVGELAAGDVLDEASWGLATLDGTSSLLDSLIRTFPAVRRELGGSNQFPMIMVAGLLPSGKEGSESANLLVLDALHVTGKPPADANGAARDAVATPLAEDLLAAIVGSIATGSNGSAAVMRAVGEASIPWRAIEAGTVPQVTGAAPDAVARLEWRSIQRQPIVVPASLPGPQGAPQLAWWYVDPLTGIVRDEHESGRHPNLTETAVKESRTPSAMERLRRFACAVATPVVVATYAVFILSGGTAGKELVKGINKAGQTEQTRRRRLEAAKQAVCGRPSGPPKP